MTFDPTSVEVTSVTLFEDHFVQVPWEYINVCGCSKSIMQNTTYYIYTTYYKHAMYILLTNIHTTYRMSDHSLFLNTVQETKSSNFWRRHITPQTPTCVQTRQTALSHQFWSALMHYIWLTNSGPPTLKIGPAAYATFPDWCPCQNCYKSLAIEEKKGVSERICTPLLNQVR